jgi:hypothetical protein
MVASTAYIIYRRSMKQSEPEEAHSKSKQSQNYFARRFSPDFPLRLLFDEFRTMIVIFKGCMVDGN